MIKRPFEQSIVFKYLLPSVSQIVPLLQQAGHVLDEWGSALEGWFMMDYAKSLALLHARLFFVRHSLKSVSWKFLNNVKALVCIKH